MRVSRQAEKGKQIRKTELLLQTLQAPPEIMTPEVITALMKDEITIEFHDSYRFNVMKILSRQLIPYFVRMIWQVVNAEEGSSFITSDSPVSIVNRAFSPPDETGIALVGTRVFCPPDSQHMLILQHPEYERSRTISPVEQIPDSILKDGRITAGCTCFCRWATTGGGHGGRASQPNLGVQATPASRA
jgi:hypothetical protein